MANETKSPRKSKALTEVFAKLRAIGEAFNPDTIAQNFKLFTPLHGQSTVPTIDVERDLRYGPDERNRLDVFLPEDEDNAPKPVLIFMHGGGFIGGDKSLPAAPFWSNVGIWAARHGLVGVNITHRLAPQHQWPAGSEDVAAAVKWVRENIAKYGGDPNRIFVMGQSAGGAHVAQYLAHERFASADRQALAGAILVSGLYDTNTMDKNPLFKAYFGEDAKLYAERSAVPGVAETTVPLLVVLAEHDPADFKRQYVELLKAFMDKKRALPHLLWLPGHGHLSTMLSIGTDDETFGDRILDFIETAGATRAVASAR